MFVLSPDNQKIHFMKDSRQAGADALQPVIRQLSFALEPRQGLEVLTLLDCFVLQGVAQLPSLLLHSPQLAFRPRQARTSI